LLNLVRFEKQTIIRAADDRESIGRVRERDELRSLIGEIAERTVGSVGYVCKKVGEPFAKTGNGRVCNKPDRNGKRIVSAGSSIKKVIANYIRIGIRIPGKGKTGVGKGASNGDAAQCRRKNSSKDETTGPRLN